jgi:pSer/pThr/pTyr-binding forkhead associated (FHA) protein
MGKKCSNPKCGYDGNQSEWEFCGKCGSDLAAAVVEVTKPAPSMQVSQDEPVTISSQKGPKPRSTKGKASLVITRNGRIGQEFPLESESASIGRWDTETGAYPEVDLAEDDTGCFISRHHARIFIKGGRYFLEDLGSANKTVLNKEAPLKPHAPVELKNGDEVIIGKVFLKFVLEP